MNALAEIAPAFIETAHRIVWATVATVDADGHPRTRVLHPIWEWEDEELAGWILTSPLSVKAKHLAHEPRISLTYWDASQDVCTADCTTAWENDVESKRAGWDRFVDGPEPVGYDPSMIPGWDSPDSDGFGVLRLHPTSLRVFPGTLLMHGTGDLLTWRG
jgi:general stress protein 26